MFKKRKVIEIINEVTGEVRNYDNIYCTGIENHAGCYVPDSSRYVVERDGKMGLIDEKGNELCKLKYIFDYYEPVGRDIYCDEGFYYVMDIDKEKFGFVDRNGKELVIKYDWVEPFCNGFAKVRLGTKYGFINTKGEEICKIEYEAVYCFYKDKKAVVKKNGKLGIIDGNGNVLCDFKYMEIGRTKNNELWEVVNFHNLCTILDEKLNFEEVLPWFDEVWINSDRPQEIRAQKDLIIGTISRDGKLLVDFKEE